MIVDPKTRQEVTQVMSHTPGIGKLWTPLMLISELFSILMGWLNLSIVVLVRHSFGSRYLSISRIILGYLTMTTFATFLYFFYGLVFTYGGWIGADSPNFAINLFPLYSRLYLLICGYHLFRSWQRQRRGIRWHSRGFGISRLTWLARQLSRLPRVFVSDFTLYRFIEPIVFGLIGFWLRRYDPIIGAWLMVSAFSLAMESHVVHNKMRSQVDDMRDATIEAEYLEAGHSLSTPKQLTHGYVALPVHTETVQEETLDITATVNAALGNVTPEEK